MTTSPQFDGHEDCDDHIQLQNLKLRYEEFPSHRVKICESTGGGREEKFASRAESEQLQETQIWGRRFSNSTRLRSALRMPPSRLSRWDSEASSSCKSAAIMMRVAALGIRWKTSTSRWWQDFPGARIGGALTVVLLLMIATTFLWCVYVYHQALKTRLFFADGMSTTSSGRFVMASFLCHYNGGQTHLDMTDGILGC